MSLRLILQCVCLALLFFRRPVESCTAAAEPEPEPEPEPARGASTDTLILCRACGHELASGTDICFVPSRLALSGRNDTSAGGGRRVHVQLLENPHGRRFEVVTFRRAAVEKLWPAERRFSWFPGFSWTVASCPSCKAHLGR